MENFPTEKRNELLYNFFNKNFPNKIFLLDYKPHLPDVIYDHDKALACHVHDYELRLTDNFHKGNVVMTIDLSNPQYDTKKFLDWFQKSKHHTMWKVRLMGTEPILYLSGYNFTDSARRQGQFPVFSHHKNKVYYTQNKAEEVLRPIKEQGYNVETSL